MTIIGGKKIMQDGEIIGRSNNPIEFNLQGTGSCPDLPQGWQLEILLTASHEPLKGPCFFIASIEYCEQVGLQRQLEPNKGEIST